MHIRSTCVRHIASSKKVKRENSIEKKPIRDEEMREYSLFFEVFCYFVSVAKKEKKMKYHRVLCWAKLKSRGKKREKNIDERRLSSLEIACLMRISKKFWHFEERDLVLTCFAMPTISIETRLIPSIQAGNGRKKRRFVSGRENVPNDYSVLRMDSANIGSSLVKNSGSSSRELVSSL